MDGVAGRRFARAGHGFDLVNAREPTETGMHLCRRLVTNELPALVVVFARQEDVERDVGVSVERVTVRERKLGALGYDVHELGLRELRKVEPLEERELLETDRTCCPGLRLADREPSIVERHDRLEGCTPASEVGAGQEPALGGNEAIDLVCYETFVEHASRGLDLVLARSATALVDDASIRRRQRRIAEERAGLPGRKVEIA